MSALIDRLYQRAIAEDDSCNPDGGDLMRAAAVRITALEDATRHFIYALDRGYLSCKDDSVFIDSLRALVL